MTILQVLERELGAASVKSDQEALDKYGTDMSGLGTYRPVAVFTPEGEAHLCAALRLAKEHALPITPRGGGTGLTGGSLPVRGGLSISFEKMNAIREIDPVSLSAVVEPGVITADFFEALDAQGLMLPPNPASMATCTIGGNVAHNASGPRSFKYGPIKDYVNALSLCLIGGEVLRCGHASVKGATGYDLTKLIVGSEGTFGITSLVHLRLVPKPKQRVTLLATFRDLVQAGVAVSSLLRAGLQPSATEIIERSSIVELKKAKKVDWADDVAAALLIECDSYGAAAEATACADILSREGASQVERFEGVEDQKNMWAVRREVYRTMKAAYPKLVLEDVCVPRAAIPRFLTALKSIAQKHALRFSTLGHIGEGNLHVGFLFRADEEVPTEKLKACFMELVGYVLSVGGTLTGEHGISFRKKDYLPWVASSELIEMQRSLKKSFDPLDLMNPGKIFAETGPAARQS